MWLPKIQFLIKRKFKNKRKIVETIAIYGAIIIALIGAIIGYVFVHDWLNELPLIQRIIELLSVLLVGAGIILPVWNISVSSMLSFSQRTINNTKLPDYKEVLGSQANIAEEVEDLLSVWVSKKKLVIFVDDLDRCDVKKIQEFFKTIHLLQQIKTIHFVFAIDPEHIENALGEMAVGENKKDYAQRYLDKYVSLFVPLESRDYTDYIDSIFMSIKESFLTEDEYQSIKIILEGIPANRLSPRKVKHVKAAVIFSKTFCIKMDNKKKIDIKELLTWHIFYLFYPLDVMQIISDESSNIECFKVKDIYKLEHNNAFDVIKDYIICDIKVYTEICSKFMIHIDTSKPEKITK